MSVDKDPWNGPTIREYSDYDVEMIKTNWFLLGVLCTIVGYIVLSPFIDMVIK